jgi:CubicO group peptidase (beta-lactamase class C family)
LENTPSEEIRVTLPGSLAPSKLPAGWSRSSEPSDAVTIVGPEGDLRVAFLKFALDCTPEEIARRAWLVFDAGFDFPVLQKIPMPGSGGWDATLQIVHNVPAAQSRSAITVLRTQGGNAYCTLILGAKAAMGRRMAQVMEILESWKPEGLSTPNFAGAERKDWGEKESAQMSEFLRLGMVQLQIPGIAMAVVQAGRIVFAEGFGTPRIGSSERVRPETRFMIGSNTKPLTTLMMARLVARGNFDWSTPVTKLLPDFALADPELTHKLEMRHTVAASTGMPPRDMDLIFKFKGITAEQRLAEMKQMKPTTDFGETFQYSNYMVALGGYAAARSFQEGNSLKEAYDQAMRELVFEPLGIERTGLNEGRGGDWASPHAIGFDGRCELLDPEMERFVPAIAPAGAVWSSATDMAMYLLLELNRGRLLSGEQLLPEDALVERWKRVTKITDKMGYGLGLLRSEEDGLDVVSHGGMTLGFTSDMYFLPQNDVGVVLLTNLFAATLLAAARQKVFELLFGAPAKAQQMIEAASLAEKQAIAGRRARVKVGAEAVAWLEGIAGEYRSRELGPLVVRGNERGYWGEFESWVSPLGIEEQPGGHLLVALVGPGLIRSLRLQVADDAETLVLDQGQYVYRFERQ